MSLLKELEQRLEALFEGFFTRQFKSGIQPVEIAKKLAREMDANRTVSVSSVYVPNRYTITVSKKDGEKLKPFEKALVSELQDFLMSHAKKEGYDLVGRPGIEIKESPELGLGELRVEGILESDDFRSTAEHERTQIIASKPRATGRTEHAYLTRTGPGGETKFLLTGRFVKIGRAVDNDIVVPDPNVSRHHARIENQASKCILKDLGSTNGTFVNGKKTGEHSLKHGDVIVVGATELRFRRETGV